ncbi:MAG TPA: nuclear transport factor 2 family protein [Terriglobales bacterium]|nr:nuclear transport factor 2 family protein [Terriglobales bacterium]
MRRILYSLILLAIFVPLATAQRKAPAHRSTAPSATQKQQFAEDQEAINDLHSRDIEASIALDADRLQSLWTDDVVMIHPGEPPIVGRDANMKKLQQHIDEMKSTEMLAYDEQFQEVHIIADTAYEWGVITGRTRPFSGGEEHPFRYNVMRILKRQPDGSWKIARSIYNDAVPPPELKKDEAKDQPTEQKKSLKD